MPIELTLIIQQMYIIGPDSLPIILLTSFFIGLVFSLQIVKEFLALNASSFVGSVLTITFIRELSPVLTSIILIGKISSYFTSELASMKITEQIDVLYVLGISPFNYLLMPRIIAFILMTPILNIFSFLSSVTSSAFFCFTLYSIHPSQFFDSAFIHLDIMDIIKSIIKSFIFGFITALISCFLGINVKGGSKEVGMSTTVSVVISLVCTFIINFILSYYMFDRVDPFLST
uniref:ABC transporter permease n=1 Tax=Ptilothamnion sphaericum TaxID=1498216 RepID=A0A4D6WXI0_9FLOR|nr:hypothetical protein [Ptilothamnion sphaericum]